MCTIDEFVCCKGDDINVVTILLEIMVTISSNAAVFECSFSCMNREESLYCEQDCVKTPWTILFALILMTHCLIILKLKDLFLIGVNLLLLRDT